jgi:predicted ATPase
VSDNGTGKSTLYNSLGQKLGLVVTIPTASGTGQGNQPDWCYRQHHGQQLCRFVHPRRRDEIGQVHFLIRNPGRHN